jgi:hypothetical protein
VETLRDFRLRHHFGERYDFRNNLIDWDYQATVKPNAGCIHYVQYRAWRNTGIAFEFGDQAYTRPNRSMASFAQGKERGRGTTLRRGFWSDVVVSPYHALGTAAAVTGDNYKKMFDVHNRHTGSEQWRHVRAPCVGVGSCVCVRACVCVCACGGGDECACGGEKPAPLHQATPCHSVTLSPCAMRFSRALQTSIEIAAVNVASFLHEIETATRYTLAKAHDIYSGLGGGTSAQCSHVHATFPPLQSRCRALAQCTLRAQVVSGVWVCARDPSRFLLLCAAPVVPPAVICCDAVRPVRVCVHVRPRETPSPLLQRAVRLW